MADGQPSRRPRSRSTRGRRGTRCATAGVHGSAGHAVPVPAALPACCSPSSCWCPAVLGIWISLHDWDFLLPQQAVRRRWTTTRRCSTPTSVQFEPFWHEHAGHRRSSPCASVPFLVVIPLGLALLLNRTFPGRTFFRAVFFAPYVLGVAVIGLMWRFLLDPSFGAVNGSSACSGCPRDIPWITDQPWAWISLVGVTVWWTIGFNAVIYLAGLAGHPAPTSTRPPTLDGATAWQQFRNVTLPGLRPVLVFVITMTILATPTCSASPT